MCSNGLGAKKVFVAVYILKSSFFFKNVLRTETKFSNIYMKNKYQKWLFGEFLFYINDDYMYRHHLNALMHPMDFNLKKSKKKSNVIIYFFQFFTLKSHNFFPYYAVSSIRIFLDVYMLSDHPDVWKLQGKYSFGDL